MCERVCLTSGFCVAIGVHDMVLTSNEANSSCLFIIGRYRSLSKYIIIYALFIVPEIQCRTAPFSNNGTIEVSWFYVHTGGLNLTQVSVSYSLDSPVLRFQQPNDSQPLAGVDSTSFVAYELQAGNNYIFKIVSSNSVGHSSATCPPVIHDIGT